MMCYRDRIYCNFNDCTKWDGCPRSLTENVKINSGLWWAAGGGNADDPNMRLS